MSLAVGYRQRNLVALTAPESNSFAAFCSCTMQVEGKDKARQTKGKHWNGQEIYLHARPGHISMMQGERPEIITW